ncbi:hypothetical protein [Flavobacterium johnsoniae]|uniref:Uncharacterized protein n=1 Tax=Flavobacterium johnsoniae TaxID=986 RepID=A0A1M5TGK0_FLAJO|nr:hypothetical protein [Flavobacterium johnsoniae]SHH49780.1 hypothetical protein SAMN05444388_111122 [Flavobacterium johnsoniae]
MNQTVKPQIVSFFKKLIIIVFLLFIFTLIEIYWAMGSLSERISSGNPDSHFFDDAYLLSVFTTVFLTIVFLLFTFIKNKYLKITIELISLISVWFFWNYSIFVDRESSWSTYLFKEELLYTLSLSFLPIWVLSIVTVFTLHYILKKL